MCFDRVFSLKAGQDETVFSTLKKGYIPETFYFFFVKTIFDTF